MDKEVVHRLGNGHHQDDEAHPQLIRKIALEAGHQHPQGDAHHQGDAHSHQAHTDGDGGLVRQDLGNSHIGPINPGGTEVPLEEALVKLHELHRQRVPQAHFGEDGFPLDIAHLVVIGPQVALFRHQAQEAKDDGDDDEQGEDRLQQPFCDVLQQMEQLLM